MVLYYMDGHKMCHIVNNILSIKPISQCNCLNCKTFSLTTDTSPISWVTLVIKNCYDMSVHNFAVPSFAAVAQSSKISK